MFTFAGVPVVRNGDGKEPDFAEFTRSKGATAPPAVHYTFKDASQLQRGKPSYVVMSPAPLGFRCVPDRAKPPRPVVSPCELAPRHL